LKNNDHDKARKIAKVKKITLYTGNKNSTDFFLSEAVETMRQLNESTKCWGKRVNLEFYIWQKCIKYEGKRNSFSGKQEVN
jgi:hypothetical protein